MNSAHTPDRARATLERLTSEAVRAESEWTALLALQREGVYGRVDLLTVTYEALFNSFAARMMRLYDQHRDAAGLRYLLNLDSELEIYFEREGLTAVTMESMSEKIRHVRDKVHMHHDRKYVADPRLAWTESGLDGDAISGLLRNTGRALRAAYQARVGTAFAGAPYDTRDLSAILAALRAAPGVWHPPIRGGRA